MAAASARCTNLVPGRIVLMLMPGPDSSHALLSLYAIGLVALSSCCAVGLLRYARFPDSGRAILAGALAGFLIGPTILGRAVPAQFEYVFVGGVPEREKRDWVRFTSTELPGAPQHVSAEDRAQMFAQGREELAAAEETLAMARREHQRPMRVFAMVIVALAMLASATRRVRAGDARQGWVTPASVGVWSAALPGAIAYVVALRWWSVDIPQAAMLGAAVGIGPWALSAIDRRVADDAEFGAAKMMQAAGRIAAMLAIALALWAGWRAQGWSGAVMFTPLLALPMSWLIPAIESRSAVLDWLIEFALAMLAALTSMQFDLYQHLAFWPLIVLALLADDGRWLGAFTGTMLVGGRPALRAMRLAMPAMACGPTQLAVAALALHGRILPERFALPLLAGALIIEITAPARRRMAAKLIETEEELSQPPTES